MTQPSEEVTQQAQRRVCVDNLVEKRNSDQDTIIREDYEFAALVYEWICMAAQLANKTQELENAKQELSGLQEEFYAFSYA